MNARRNVIRTIAVALSLTIAAVFAGTSVRAQTVTINGRQMYLNPGPIERSGRVFVPLRGIFEQLGASVVYNSGTINATKGQTTVSLHIGSTQATINGQSQSLDVAPFIVGATTYVPLRFVAQSLGANVGYDASTRVVSITHVSGGGAPPPMPPPRPPYPPPYPPPGMLYLQSHQPAPGSQTTNRYVTVSASFSRPVRPATVRVWLDGNDITSFSNIGPNRISYQPRTELYVGSHTVRVAGTDNAGARFDRSWSFNVVGGGPGPINLRAQQPAPDSKVSTQFPGISAQFTSPVQAGSVRVYLDGADRTGQCGISSTSFSYKPPAPLDYGSHTVRVAGRGAGGASFDRSWSFSVVRSGPGMSLTINTPSSNQSVGSVFEVQGATAGNAKVNVTAGPAGSPMGLYAGTTTAGPQGNFRLSVSLRPMPGLQAITLKVTATNPNNGQVAQQTLQLRVGQ